MGALSKKLRSIGGDGYKGLGFWCAGCDECHIIYVASPTGPVWEWDGNVEAPTCSPSIKVTAHHLNSVCHFFIRAGNFEFCGDSTHELAGKTVPMIDWPYAEGEYGGV
jgi:hypothetical protein